VFRSTQIERKSSKSSTVHGNLTIRAQTHAVVLAVSIDPAWPGPSAERLVCKASTRIDRRDFDLQWNAALEAGGLLVADAVEIAIDLVARPAA
jgi:polyisoprenoid-binding protein YceI